MEKEIKKIAYIDKHKYINFSGFGEEIGKVTESYAELHNFKEALNKSSLREQFNLIKSNWEYWIKIKEKFSPHWQKVYNSIENVQFYKNWNILD